VVFVLNQDVPDEVFLFIGQILKELDFIDEGTIFRELFLADLRDSLAKTYSVDSP
jgi:hypothetical protein